MTNNNTPKSIILFSGTCSICHEDTKTLRNHKGFLSEALSLRARWR